jgi:raffinose synthase
MSSRRARGAGVASRAPRLVGGELRFGSVPLLVGVSASFTVESVDARAAPDARGTAERVDAAILGFEHVEDGVVQPLSRHVVRLASELRCARFTACGRCKLWWMTPAWGSDASEIPAETQFLLVELGDRAGRPNGAYAAFLPMISPDGFRATLSGHANDARDCAGALALVAESGCDDVVARGVRDALAVAVSDSPFTAVEAVVDLASRRMGTFGLRRDKRTPPVADVFGWCTWDAFYHRVTPAGVESGVASLANGGVPARFVIVDDGWQSVAPDAAYRKRVDHISDHPPPPRPAKRRKTAAAAHGAGAAGGGVVQWAGAAMAASLESVYWNGIHGAPYGTASWRAFRFLGRYVLGPAIRAAISTLSCFNHRVSALEANVKFQDGGEGGVGSKRKAGDGLGRVVARIKALGVEHVYCWHALFGYWGGLHPDEPGVARFEPKMTRPKHTPGVLTVEPSQAWDPITLGGVGVAPPERLAQFYRELHAYLAAAGVDGIKVDGQAVVGGLGGGVGGGPALARRLHEALEASAATHFPTNGLINCMCHSSENILNFSGSALARVSDDFYPTNRASHTVHIANVAYNSVFMGEIAVPDWDMFQSHCGEAGALHAAARAVGGCPVYVSDAPNTHDFHLLRQLVFPSGRVLRARLPGRPTRDCLFADVCRDGTSALKIWNRNQRGGVVGCFNIQGAAWSRAKGVFVFNADEPGAVDAAVAPEDVEGIDDDRDEPARGETPTATATATAREGDDPSDDRGRAFIVRAHRSRAMRRMAKDARWIRSLEPKQWEVFTVAPVERVGDVEWTPVALDQMLNGGGAVREATLEETSDGTGTPGGASGSPGTPKSKKSRANAKSNANANANANAKAKKPSPSPSTFVRGAATVYGCGALVCYSNRAPDDVRVDGASVRGWTWSKRDGCLTIPLGTREGTHDVAATFRATRIVPTS